MLCLPPPQGIKDLAWNNAYELSNVGGTLTKKAYKKNGLNDFFLDKTFTKSTVNETWQALAKVFEFDGNLAGSQAVQLSAGIYCVKVSDKFFDTNELVGSTINTIGTVNNEEVEPTAYIITGANIAEDYVEELDLKIVGIAVEDAGDAGLLISIDRDYNEAGFSSGTYFIMYVFTEDFSERAYTKSISCLTEADVIPALTNRLTPEEIFSLDLTNGFDNLQHVNVVNVDNELTYIKVTDKYLTERDLLYYSMAIYVSISNTSSGYMQGIINPEYITAFSDESNDNNYLAVSILACLEQNGWEGSNDFPAILSSSTAFTYQNKSFESGTYFVLCRTTYDGYLYLKSVSSLSKADAIQM